MAAQLKLPVRGATYLTCAKSVGRRNFNPRSPRGERPVGCGWCRCARRISIHAPREGSDKRIVMQMLLGQDFNPRSPRGERRCKSPWTPSRCRYFNPRSPRGERPVTDGTSGALTATFQSTLPARGATFLFQRGYVVLDDFNPRSPRGERPVGRSIRKQE